MLMIVSRECEVLCKDDGFGGQRWHLRMNLCRNVTTLHIGDNAANCSLLTAHCGKSVNELRITVRMCDAVSEQ
jgi:hypothetical protein